MLAAACSPAPTEFIGTDFSGQEDLDRIANGAGASIEDLEPPEGLAGLVRPIPSPLCVAPFEACGGLLAGEWLAKETCNGETHNPKALQIWGQTFMRLDTTACWDAVQSVTSEFMGELAFEGGAAKDTRMRRDTIQMTLDRGCLNATYNANIRAESIPSVCASLTDSMTSCAPVNGACSCTGRRENRMSKSGTYGVLGTWVAIGPDNPPKFVEYCVRGDLLTWREEGSPRHVVFQRVGEQPNEEDPQYPR